MMPLHLIRIPIATAELARWAGERGWIRHRGREIGFDEGRALHHLLNEVWGRGALQPFRLLVPPRRPAGNLYAYSVEDVESLRSKAMESALPEHLEILSLENLAGKRMPGDWRTGQRLGFDILLRPVRRLDKDLEMESRRFPKGAEIDAFLLEAWRQHGTDSDGMAKTARSRDSVYLDWLEERLQTAARIERSDSRLVRFRRVRASRGNGGPEGPDAVLQGTLTVENTDAFAERLARGVGRHRAFGYGMLLLRPPARPVSES